jgi:ATP-binding cassette, subfamily C (CFTR/MRP), member 1
MAAARHLFDRVIGPHGLLATRARLLVTHAIGFVPQCDHIVVMRDGRIASQGSYLELMASGSNLSQLVSEREARQESPSGSRSGGSAGSEEDSDAGPSSPGSSGAGRQRRDSTASIGRASLASVAERAKEQDRGAQSLMTEEKSAEGRVGWDVYRAYIKAMSVSGAAGVVCLMVVATACDAGEPARTSPAHRTGLAAVSLGGPRQGWGCGSRCGARRPRSRAATSTCSRTWACTA